MNELIKITNERVEGKETVSARELYEFLGYQSNKFARWSKSKIEDNDFIIQGVDYVRLDTVVQRNRTIDYCLTIETDKKLSMIAQTEKGEKVRDCFIQCEKKLKEIKTPQLPKTFAEALRLAADQAEQIELLEPIDGSTVIGVKV